MEHGEIESTSKNAEVEMNLLLSTAFVLIVLGAWLGIASAVSAVAWLALLGLFMAMLRLP